ncbi:nucleotide pyrophosphohydrolase [Candidatus Woesearchaeota archaeon]|nr:nucleotide pyrophosphohydrolase [Candidatus Woesearchaeota archaeon]
MHSSQKNTPSDRTTRVAELKEAVDRFRTERDWKQFHKPKDLGVALVTEVGELLEHFRYKSDEGITAYMCDPKNKRDVEHELADVINLSLLLAIELDIDVSKAFFDKLEVSAKKYPVHLAKGKASKYTEYKEILMKNLQS